MGAARILFRFFFRLANFDATVGLFFGELSMWPIRLGFDGAGCETA